MNKHLLPAIFLCVFGSSAAHANCSVTYVFSNGTTADATQVNTNFSDIINCAAPLASPQFTGTAMIPMGKLRVATTANTDPLLNPVSLNVGTHNTFGTTAIHGGATNGHGVIGYDSDGGYGLYSILNSTYGDFLGFNFNGSLVSYWSTNGSTSTFNNPSDARLKNWHVNQANYRDAIRKLEIGDFDWKLNSAPDFGIRAQQAYAAFSGTPFQSLLVKKPENDDPTCDPATHQECKWVAANDYLGRMALWGVKDIYTQNDQLTKAVALQEENSSTLRSSLIAAQATIAKQSAAIERLERSVAKLEAHHERVALNR